MMPYQMLIINKALWICLYVHVQSTGPWLCALSQFAGLQDQLLYMRAPYRDRSQSAADWPIAGHPILLD